MSKPVCLVTGVGPAKGTGGEIVKRFAEGGYQVAMLARNTENLKTLEKNIENAVAFPCDVGDLELLVKTIEQIKETLGHPEVVIHNALRSVRGSILELDPDDLERNFRVNTTALLHLARETLPAMIDAGKGLFWSQVIHRQPAVKTNWGFLLYEGRAAYSCESIAREFGPKGIHTAYFIIDASIDTPRTRPMLAPDKPDEFLLNHPR
ncbi:MAG: short-chain dehydrogenase [Rhodospirillaceae bacterium]|nr:MAG: short-chain dehydrogenase [Rhodospirillaceae bacterium]